MKESEFREDPRYRIAAKEAWMSIGLFLLNFCWWYAFAFGMGSQEPQNYSYVLGFPAWFFWSVIAGTAVFSLLAFLMVQYYFTDMPLGAEENNFPDEER